MGNIKARVNQIAASFALCLLLAVNGTAQTGTSNQDLTARVDEYLNALVKQDRFSGAVLLARDGKVLLSKGYGMANFEDEKQNSESRSQKSEEKKRKSVDVVSASSFWLLTPDSCFSLTLGRI
jgi:CubicO group peptidase (beta-lactamase class C family)